MTTEQARAYIARLTLEEKQRLNKFSKVAGKGGAGMTNNERFNAMLNGCENPQAVYGALAAIAAQEARETFPERFVGKSDREIINEIAAIVHDLDTSVA